MATIRRVEKMTRVLRNRQPDLTVVFENIHDPHNVSAVFRTCDAVGVDRVHLLYTDQEFPDIGKKSSSSAKKWVEVSRHRDAQHLRAELKASGFTIYATHLSPTARSHFDVDWTHPSAIILGNEHAGVSDAALAIADETLFIPMQGMIQSLNVSVAGAVLLYEACRQRMAAGRYPNPDHDPQSIQARLDEWTRK